MKKVAKMFLAVWMMISTGCTSAPREGAGTSGIFEGVGYSIEGTYTVKVTLENSVIQDVQVETHFPESLPDHFKEDGTKAVNAVAADIRKNNALEADMISGATVTCQAVLDGAAQALGKAGLIQNENIRLTDGTYERMIFGNNDMITVETVIKDNAIDSVKVLSDHETAGVGSVLKDADGTVITNGGRYPTVSIPEEITANQTLDVDVVTGATVTSYAVLTAVKGCIRDAGGNSWLFRGRPETTHAEQEQSDVVIVGAGGSGLAAAVCLAQEGKHVILIEKNGSVGGNTLVCGAIYNSPDEARQKSGIMNEAQKKTVEEALAMTSEDPDLQKTLEELQEPVRAQWEAFQKDQKEGIFDSAEWYTLQTWLGGDMVADPSLVRILCENAEDGLEWITSLGVEFDPEITQGAGSLWQRTHTSVMPMGTGYITAYLNELDRYRDQIELRTECTAAELIMEDGNVAGVKVVFNHDGAEEIVLAREGVILSTGGFSANSEMVQENNTSGKWPDLSYLPTTNRAGASGDGIRMAESAGAALTDMDQIQLLYLGNLQDGQLTKYPPRDVNGTDQIIFINKEGRRFVREDGRRDEICLAILKQPDGQFYMLESGDGDYKDIHDDSWRSADGFSFAYLEENGYVVTEDTVEALAEKLDMDPKVLQETIDSFNKCVDGKQEDEFGRTLYSVRLENGPWVSAPRQVSIHHTMGGIHIDENCHVLNAEEEIIPGLYAAGEVTGGIHGANRLGGNAVVETVVFGKRCAETILSETE